MSIVEFLLARIAEDEEIAHVASDPSEVWEVEVSDAHHTFAQVCAVGDGAVASSVLTVDAEHIARYDPKRVLAECAAKRAIIEWHRNWPVLVEAPALHILAAVYADHPDYREEWKP